MEPASVANPNTNNLHQPTVPPHSNVPSSEHAVSTHDSQELDKNPRRQEIDRPSIHEMMASSTGTYQCHIKSFEEAKALNEEYLTQLHQDASFCGDFPKDNEKRQNLVRVLFEAAHDCENTYEPPSATSVKWIKQGKYKDFQWELVLWSLLVSFSKVALVIDLIASVLEIHPTCPEGEMRRSYSLRRKSG